MTANERRLAAVRETRAIAERSRRTGMCSKDVFVGFNSRRSCGLKAGHPGRCA